MALVFISYNVNDSDIASRIQSFIMRTFNLSTDEVFLSSESLSAGASVEGDILRAIRDSRYLIYILSENYFQSQYCMCELGAVWALEKNPFMFLVSPIGFNNEKYKSLPPSFNNIQSVVVRGGDRHKINKYLEDMIEQIKIHKSIEGAGEFSAYGDNLIKLCKFLSESPHSEKVIEMRNCFAFHNPPETHSTLKILSAQQNKVSMFVDYSGIKPCFAGCAIPLNNQSWQYECSYGYSLSFSIQATIPLKEVTLEIKGKERSIIKRKVIELNNEPTFISYKLSDLNTPETFKDMTELVFLFLPDRFDAVSKIEISNISLYYTSL